MGSVAATAMQSRHRQVFIPLLAVLGLLLFSLLPRIQQNDTLLYSVLAAAGGLLLWQLLLVLTLKASGETRGLVFPKPKPQHYIQAMVHTSIYLYWGFYWRPVYDYAGLLLVQLVFAYGFDMLLSWSRGKDYHLGFGPFPIIFSTNLFMWFRDDWYYLQFLLLALGFLGKEFVRWNRDGRLVHIFNPSAFSLGLFSLILIATGTTHLTWGQEIASTLTLAPGIYLYLFLAGLVVMYFFSITLVAAAAAATLFGLSALYSTLTGVPYFLDSEIPAAVFLGLHLLVTDPSTSPRTPPGKLIFGVLYGLGVFALYSLLSTMGAPTFYDKLLCVPLLNLSVQAIDRSVHVLQNRPMLSRLGLDKPGRRANLMHMSVWIVFFAVMSLLGRADGRHPGDSLPFWQQACAEERANACQRLVLLENTYCGDGSGWACNSLGLRNWQGQLVEQSQERALQYFARGCELRFQAACLNLLEPDAGLNSDPRELDLRLLLREGGLNLLEMPAPDLYERACSHGWEFACE
ncbi:MAG: hypothetical protein RQ757_11170 [Pseudomonadales bacterium]|nr:hypothetical protein [Pseudomonadales bacterium]